MLCCAVPMPSRENANPVPSGFLETNPFERLGFLPSWIFESSKRLDSRIPSHGIAYSVSVSKPWDRVPSYFVLRNSRFENVNTAKLGSTVSSVKYRIRPIRPIWAENTVS